MWTIGRYDLRLSEDEFWRLTLRQFDALCCRHEKVKRQEMVWDSTNTALICSLLANIHRDAKERPEPFELDDFMLIPREKTPPQPQTWQEQLVIVEMLNAALGGKDHRSKRREVVRTENE